MIILTMMVKSLQMTRIAIKAKGIFVMASQALMFVANQIGATLLPDNAQWKNRMNIRSSSSDKLYTVAQRKSDNSWGCDCMGWKARRTCKHLKTMLPALEQAEKRLQIRG